VTSFKDNAESKLLEKTATTKSPNKEEEEAVDSSGEKSTKNGWAIPADESQQPQLQQQSPGKQMSPGKRTPLPLSPVKLISPMKRIRANAADFIYRSSPTKPVSSRAQRTIAFWFAFGASVLMLSKILKFSSSSTPVLDRRIRMDANRLKWRKLIFRHLLVERVREAHRKFLTEHKCFVPLIICSFEHIFHKYANFTIQWSSTIPRVCTRNSGRRWTSWWPTLGRRGPFLDAPSSSNKPIPPVVQICRPPTFALSFRFFSIKFRVQKSLDIPPKRV
jgi:hypothetical protein